MKNPFLFFLLIPIVFSCSDGTDCCPQPNPVLQYSLISVGGLQGDALQKIPVGNFIITEEEEWQGLIEKMDLGQIYSDPYLQKEIDFTKSKVLAIFDSIRPHTGYRIFISDIDKTEENIIVQIETDSIPNGFFVENRPYFIVMTPITEKPIKFE